MLLRIISNDVYFRWYFRVLTIDQGTADNCDPCLETTIGSNVDGGDRRR